MLLIRIPDLSSINDAARELINTFPDKRIFAFYGEMGAGKTTLIKALCRVLQVTDVTSSPSFGLIYEYQTRGSESVYHFDFYRIESIEEVFDIGYEEYMYSGDYCFLEWPELIEPILPGDTIRISIKICEAEERELEVME